MSLACHNIILFSESCVDVERYLNLTKHDNGLNIVERMRMYGDALPIGCREDSRLYNGKTMNSYIALNRINKETPIEEHNHVNGSKNKMISNSDST